MSDKKISGSHLYSQSPNEKTDDLKSLFISKISSTEWASILIKKFCEEDVKNKAFEISYGQALKTIEMMKEINKNLYKAAISADFLDKFIEKCDDLSIISLFLKDYLSNYSSGYDNYSYTGYSKKTDLLNVVKSLENKIKKAEYDQVLEKMLYTEIYSEMLIAKKNNKNDNTYTKNEHLQDIREKIKIVIAVLIESQIGELLKILENLQETFVKWIVILDSSCDYEEMKFLKILATVLAPPKTNYYTVPKLKYEQIWKLLKIIIEACKYSYSDNEIILPFSNAFVYFELYENKQWEDLSAFSAKYIIETYSPKEISCFFKNIINESYTEGILIFFYYLTKSLEKKNCPLFLITFFNEVVLISIITKLQSEIYFKITIAILNLYLFGLSDICTINEKHWDILISSANYVIHFEKKNIQEYYEFIKCLHKIYQKLKKQLYNDREILNFLDNMKMNYIFLNDPSEKSIDFFLSHSWKIKLTEDLIKQIPNSYIDIETPNNIVKYKGLKNMGNTCYINSFVQCLNMTLEFRRQTLNVDIKKLPQDSVLTELKQMFKNFEEETFETFFDPIILKNALPEPFKSSLEQQDALEFGRIFLEIIENLLIDANQKNFVENLFFGECVNTFACEDCKNSNKMNEKILDLSINFSDDSYLPREGAYDMKKMISNFVQKEEFRDKNQYFCDKCNKLSKLMIKTPTIKKLPPFLLITANRFYFDAKLGLRRKLCHKIKECHIFTIKEVFDGACKSANPLEEYILYAMIIHAGASLESGHYFAIAKDFSEKYWYVFNDTVVQCLGKSPNFNRHLWDYETPYIYFFVNRAVIPKK